LQILGRGEIEWAQEGRKKRKDLVQTDRNHPWAERKGPDPWGLEREPEQEERELKHLAKKNDAVERTGGGKR